MQSLFEGGRGGLIVFDPFREPPENQCVSLPVGQMFRRGNGAHGAALPTSQETDGLVQAVFVHGQAVARPTMGPTTDAVPQPWTTMSNRSVPRTAIWFRSKTLCELT